MSWIITNWLFVWMVAQLALTGALAIIATYAAE